MRDLILHHPVKTAGFDESARTRQQKYEAGIGRVMRMHGYPFWYFPSACLRTCAGILLALGSGNFPKARFKYVSVLARMRGWRG
jgi:hypothetical protein